MKKLFVMLVFGLISLCFCRAELSGNVSLSKGDLVKGEPSRAVNIVSIQAGDENSVVLTNQYKFVNNTDDVLSFCFDGVGSNNFVLWFANSEITIVPNTGVPACIVLNPVSMGANSDCLFNYSSTTTLSYTVSHAYTSNYTSQECQEEYSLMPISSCDTNYCVENDLCPLSSGSRSELMINNIVHEGKPLINISIPDNIYWDYATDDNQFDLYVGSGYNQDYIDSVLAINSYRPDNEDFTNIFVSGLTLIFPYIFVALLIVFIWKLLKRIFK